MATKLTIQQRFNELATQPFGQRVVNGSLYVEEESWGAWSASALNLIQMVFGSESAHYSQIKAIIEDKSHRYYLHAIQALGVFQGAKADYEKGCYGSLERMVSGEVFGNFIGAAKQALGEGNKDVAAVLACAALEDALKRYANTNGLNADGKDMSEIVGALKSKGLVGGAQKSILETMPKTRNAAMHADWSKISIAEVGGVIGFTEQFLLQNFS
ncbi:MAG: DUF4145 domain-containing protein [Minisyncoccia bacterium]